MNLWDLEVKDDLPKLFGPRQILLSLAGTI